MANDRNQLIQWCDHTKICTWTYDRKLLIEINVLATLQFKTNVELSQSKENGHFKPFYITNW